MISILSSDIEQTTENEKKNFKNLLATVTIYFLYYREKKIQYRTEICKK